MRERVYCTCMNTTSIYEAIIVYMKSPNMSTERFHHVIRLLGKRCFAFRSDNDARKVTCDRITTRMAEGAEQAPEL